TTVDREPAPRRVGRSRRFAAGTVGVGWTDALAASKLLRLLPTSGSVAARKRRSDRSFVRIPDNAADRRLLRPRPGVAGVESGGEPRVEGGMPRRRWIATPATAGRVGGGRDRAGDGVAGRRRAARQQLRTDESRGTRFRLAQSLFDERPDARHFS